jgi:DnaK suppressor protein
MNKLNAQKFMSLFNTMLTDRNGNSINLKKTTDNTSAAQMKGDEVDIVTAQKEELLNDRLNERNLLFLKKVEAAKQKIADGTYGICEDCGAEISQKRLLARPTADLCIGCQEEKEKEKFGSFKHRRDLKSGTITEENDGYIDERKFTSVKDIGFESVVDM